MRTQEPIAPLTCAGTRPQSKWRGDAGKCVGRAGDDDISFVVRSGSPF
jgi:hypothetical protein